MVSWTDMLVQSRKAAQATVPLSFTGLKLKSNVKAKAALVAKTPSYSAPKSKEQATSDALDDQIKKGGWEGFAASAGKVANTPVIKQLIDVLSVGGYATANAADETLAAIEDNKSGKADIGQTLGRVMNAGNVGIERGIKAGLGSDNDVKTYSDVIKRVQKMYGADTENDAAKWGQGLGGFVGDVALDPLTYFSFGGTALAKGAIRGAVEGGKSATVKAAQGIAKGADPTSKIANRSLEEIANQTPGIGNRFKQAGKEAKLELDKYKADNGGSAVQIGLPFGHKKAPSSSDAVPFSGRIAPEQEATNAAGTPLSEVEKLIKEARLGDKVAVINDAAKAKVGGMTTNFEDALKIPFENQMDEVVTKVDPKDLNQQADVLPDEVTPLPKTPKVEVSNIVTEANKTLSDPDKGVARLKNLLENYEFKTADQTIQKLVDDPEAAAVALGPEAGAGALPSGANKKGTPAASTSVSFKPADVLTELIGNVRATNGLIKFGPTQRSSKEVTEILENALASGSPAAASAIIKRLDPALVKPVLDKLSKTSNAASVGKVTPAKPVQKSVEEIVPGKVTQSKADILKIIKAMPDEEIAKIADLLGFPTHSKSQVISYLRDTPNLFQNYTKALKNIKSEAKKLSTEELKHQRNIKNIREMAGKDYEAVKALTKLSPEYVRTRQLNNAIKAEEELANGITKADGESAITGRDLKNISDNTLAAFIHQQGNPELVMQTKRKYITDTADKDSGNVSHPGLAPTYSAIRPFQQMVTDLRAFSGTTTIQERLQAVLKVAQSVDTKIRALGFNPTLNLARRPKEQKTINLSFYDVIDSLHTVKNGDQLIIKHFIGSGKNGVEITTGMSAIEGLIRGAHDGLPVAQLQERIYKILMGYDSAYPHYKKTAELVRSFMNKTPIAAKQKTGMTLADARKEYAEQMNAFAHKLVTDPDLLHVLNDRMKLNALQHGVSVRAPIQQATDAQQEIVRAMAIDPAKSAGDYINQILKEAKKDIAANTPQGAKAFADKALDDLKNGALTIPEQSAIDFGIKVREAAKKAAEAPKVTPEFIQKVVNKANAKRGADPQLEEVAKTHLENDIDVPSVGKDSNEPLPYDVMNASIARDTWQRIHPAASFFDARFGMSTLAYRDINTGNHTVANMLNSFHNNVLKYLEKNRESVYGDFQDIVKALQAARDTNMPPLTGGLPQSAQELFSVMSTVVDPSDMNVFATSGIASAHFNTLATSKGLASKYGIELNIGKTPQENTLAWIDAKNINNADDVFDFISRYDSVLTHAASEISIAANFQKHFASDVAKPGWKKITWGRRKEDDYGFYELLDHDKYYDPEALLQIASVDKMLKESRTISNNTSVGRFMNNVFDPLTNVLKASQTTVRPGHWVMSFSGDMMRNFIAGITSLKPYKHSFGIMRAMHLDASVFGDNPLDALRYARKNAFGGYEVKADAKIDKNVAIRIGGKLQNVSYTSFGRMVQGTITIPGYKGGVMEDYLRDEASTLGNFANTVNGAMDKVLSNPKFNANRLSAQRDNFSRIALAVDYAQKNKFKNIEDLKRGMEEYVTKWAPTSTDFGARESKYARRAFLYYTWLRGITPRIMDLIVTRPGTATAANKALYNFAIANGMDPVSIGNPFPEEGMFPSYYYNNIIGPQWKDRDGSMWGINPSSPVIEVLNSLGKGITPAGLAQPFSPESSYNKVGANLMGMATPFAKMPVELASQQSNGVPIKDNFQYLQDNLGGSWVSAASRGTGTLINGQGRTDSANRPDQAGQNEQLTTQLINFMTGAKLTDFQSDSALRSFTGEQNDKRQNERAQLKRNM